MMDYFSRPIAKRTRSSEAAHFKIVGEELKRSRASSSSTGGAGGGGGGCSSVQSSGGGGDNVSSGRKRDSCTDLVGGIGSRRGPSGQFGNNKRSELGGGGGIFPAIPISVAIPISTAGAGGCSNAQSSIGGGRGAKEDIVEMGNEPRLEKCKKAFVLLDYEDEVHDTRRKPLKIQKREKVYVISDDEEEHDTRRNDGLKRRKSDYEIAREKAIEIQRQDREEERKEKLEAVRKVEEWRRIREVAEKERIEKDEALRKIEEWRRIRELAEKGSRERKRGGDCALFKGKSVVNKLESSKGGNAVHTVDVDSDLSTSSGFSSQSSSSNSDNDDSGDEDFVLDREEEGDEEGDEDGEDTDDGIAYPLNHSTLIKKNRSFVDLEDEVEEEKIRAEKQSMKKRGVGVSKFPKHLPQMNISTESDQSFNKYEAEEDIQESTNQVGNETAVDTASKIEMMAESTAKSLDKGGAEEEMEDLTNQVLGEIGKDISPQVESDQSLDKDEAEEKLKMFTNQKSPWDSILGLGKGKSDSVNCIKEPEKTKEDNSIPVKRGRGRPKKVVVIEEAGEKSMCHNTANIDQPRRKRGRPKKEVVLLENTYKTKMLSESTANRLDKDEAKEEAEEFTKQVLEEIGVHIPPQLSSVCRGGIASKKLDVEGDMERKHKRASKTDSLLNLFVNTIWEKDGMLQQEVEAPQKETDPIEPETVLQYKFTYSDDEESVPEKSDYEKEIDQLWDEMDFALRSSEDGTFAPSTAAVEEEVEQPIETDPYTSCSLGKHQPILHEEIGLICMFCSFVMLERRYILPDFATPSAKGRQDKRMSAGNEEFPMSDSFPLYATTGDQGSNLHTSGPVRDKLDKFPWKLYPHQIEGIEFLWKNLAGGIDVDAKNMNPSHEVGGCIISHAPGTGKTLLTIAFLRTFMETFPDCKPILMAPSSMLLTWEEEFKKWNVGIKFHNLSSLKFSGDEDFAARKLVGNRRSTSWRHIVKAFSWCKGNSILAVSYQIFEKLATEEPGEDKEEIPGYTAEMRKIILEKPGLVILDEGHTPRNKNSKIYKCLKKLKTERRIILSGTPFQNNFDELFTTMWLVRPKFADTISSATEKRGEELRGDWVSLTSSIGKSSQDQLLEKIQKMIEPFVHVHEGSILEKKLPGLREYVVVLHPPPLQKKLLAKVREGMKNSFELDRAIAVVSVHPHLLTKCKCSVAKQSKTGKSCVTTLIDENKQIKEDAFRLNSHEGVKTRFLMQLIKLSEAMNEKVLVFSQFLDPHSLVCDHLYAALGWRMGEEIIQIDGSLDVNKRQVLINRFNDPNSKVKVLLASTKACGEGISLTGASRLVLLDVVWNPSVQKQAISRAYRLGQNKVVYTYNLITSGTLEEDKYCVQSRKHHLSQLVFSTEHGKTENPENPSSKFSDDKILQEMMGNEELKGMFDKIIPKESTLLETLGGAPSIQP